MTIRFRTLFLGVFSIAALPVAAVSAADLGSRTSPAVAPDAAEVAGVPGDEIFGFTTPTDPGNKGDTQYFNENDGRIGKRDGSYRALNSKFALGYTFADNWWIGGAFFTAYNRVSNVTGLPDVSGLNFDGLSIELLHRILERGAGNPFAITLSVEPRWGRIDGVSGLSSNNVGSTFKFLVDAPVIADKLYWAGNLQYTLTRADDPFTQGQTLRSSQLLISSALTWQFSQSLFAGAEARYFTVSDNYTLSHETDRALYVGPTMLWKATDKVAVNVTYQPQVYGRSTASPGRSLDLDAFERAQFRAKLVVGF